MLSSSLLSFIGRPDYQTRLRGSEAGSGAAGKPSPRNHILHHLIRDEVTPDEPAERVIILVEVTFR